jgi:uncharacterized protein (TIGR02271 family)
MSKKDKSKRHKRKPIPKTDTVEPSAAITPAKVQQTLVPMGAVSVANTMSQPKRPTSMLASKAASQAEFAGDDNVAARENPATSKVETDFAAELIEPEYVGSNEIVIPLLEEVLSISKRDVETGRIEINRTTHDRAKLVEALLEREQVEIERTAIGSLVDAIPEVREEGDGIIVVPIVEEVLVTRRQLVLKEEVHVRRLRDEVQHREFVSVREQEAVVARLPPVEAAKGCENGIGPLAFMRILADGGIDQWKHSCEFLGSTSSWFTSSLNKDTFESVKQLQVMQQAMQEELLGATTATFRTALRFATAIAGMSTFRRNRNADVG